MTFENLMSLHYMSWLSVCTSWLQIDYIKFPHEKPGIDGTAFRVCRVTIILDYDFDAIMSRVCFINDYRNIAVTVSNKVSSKAHKHPTIMWSNQKFCKEILKICDQNSNKKVSKEILTFTFVWTSFFWLSSSTM